MTFKKIFFRRNISFLHNEVREYSNDLKSESNDLKLCMIHKIGNKWLK